LIPLIHQLLINGRPISVDVPSNMPLLWVLREVLGLTGTKYGCGIGACGACTVHLEGQAVRSCQIPVIQAVGRPVVTIEGLAATEPLSPVLRAWKELDVPQCGFCQPGQIMAASALLAQDPQANPDKMTNLCRCGTYSGIRAAIQRASALILAQKNGTSGTSSSEWD
jgi:isoquinoline 1-oxidoreductase alpha subunit